ncbi:ATP-grasp domain-containing protein [Halorarius litoreus]|uniref:carboxylate--amine ligase n=1 Tax=Halorarius litoreus TaxID=2962676 RepID=UPI0020CFBB4A|nr:ATP-grasp domain-containing protein [Halorarius litoreus]
MTNNSVRALVLDANGQAGLAIVRSLGRQGICVTAGSHVAPSIGGVSRYSDATYRYPDPAKSAERFVDHLVEFLRTVDHYVVIPVQDGTSTLLSRHKDRIEATGTLVAVEDWPTFERAFDKGTLFEIAASLDVPIPTTFAPTSITEVEEIATQLTYPALVKPRSKTVRDADGHCHRVLIDDDYYADSPAELVDAYRRILARYPVLEVERHYPLVQERVPGTTTTTVVVADRGEILTHFQEERVRTVPASGGNSTLLRALTEPRMLEYAREVIAALDWTGPAMVEFMRTPDDEFYLIEVNGRYWGSVPFAIASGVDIPWHHFQLLRGEPVAQPDSYRVARLHHRLLYGDLKWLNEQLHRGHPTAVLHVLWACLVAEQTFVSTSDPVPTVWALRQAVGLGADALRRRLSRAEMGDPGGHPSIN